MAIDTMEMRARTAERGSDLANDLAGTARKTVGEMTERTRSAVGQVAESAAQVADQVGTRTSDTLAQALRYTSAHPLQALAVVLVAGFVVGRLSRRY